MKSKLLIKLIVILTASCCCLDGKPGVQVQGQLAKNHPQKPNPDPNAKKKCLESVPKFEGTMESFVVKIIYLVKCNMHEGIPAMKIPPMDPLRIPDYDLNLEKPNVKITGKLRNTTLTNLSSFNVTDLKIDLLDLTANISVYIPFFIVQGSYDMNGMALHIFPIYGKGPFTLKPVSITCAVFASAGVNDNDNIILKSLEFKLDVKNLNSRFEGLMGGGKLGNFLNKIIDSLGVYLFHKMEPKVHDQVRSILIDEVNKLLKSFKLTDLLERAF